METHIHIYRILIIALFGVVLSTFYLLGKIKKGHMTREKEKFAGQILFLICIVCGTSGLITAMYFNVGSKTLPVFFSLTFFGISISPIAMILGKVNKG